MRKSQRKLSLRPADRWKAKPALAGRAAPGGTFFATKRRNSNGLAPGQLNREPTQVEIMRAVMKNSPPRAPGWALLSLILATANRAGADPVVEAVSLASPSIHANAGNSDSSGSVISADGRFVLFLSSASNLATNDDAGKYVDVFLRNRTNNTTSLLSVNVSGTGGGNGHSISPVISADGRFVAFESAASNLVADDANNVSDIFLRDLLTNTTTLVSVNRAGTGPGNGASTSPLISADGRYVAFVSVATDLVDNDTNAATDVFVRDLQNGTTTLVSLRADGLTGGNGDSDSPAMTPDGRWLAFVSKATNLVAGVTNTLGEVYARDFVSGTTLWVSSNALPIALSLTPTNNYRIVSYNPVISADGKFVAFKADAFPASLLLRQSLQTGATDLLSSKAVGNAFAPDDSSGPDMTPDGRYVAFTEANDLNGTFSAVYLWDGQSGTRTLVSANLSGVISSNTFSDTPAISADGRFVAFVSDATDLVSSSVDGGGQVYVRDLVNGTTKLASADIDGGVSADAFGAIPTITADGRYIAFDNSDGNYVTGDNNNQFDVFVRDTTTDTTELISQANPAVQTSTADDLS